MKKFILLGAFALIISALVITPAMAASNEGALKKGITDTAKAIDKNVDKKQLNKDLNKGAKKVEKGVKDLKK